MNANELADWITKTYVVMKQGKEYEIATMLRQQQAEIEELKTCLIVEQEHNERMVEDRSKYEALAHAGGVEAGKELAVMEVMSKHCTCYKLGYSPLNDYALIKQK